MIEYWEIGGGRVVAGASKVRRAEKHGTRGDAASALLTRAAIAAEGHVRVTCRGRSMLPTLRDGDAVEVVAKRAEIADVVLIDQGTTLVLHRLVACVVVPGGGTIIVHCGDAHWRTAGLARSSRVLGVAKGVARREGGDFPVGRWAVAAWAMGRYAPGLAWRIVRGAIRSRVS